MVPVLAYPSPLFNADEKIIGAFKVMVDVSEFRKIEMVLRSQEREYRTLLENSVDVIIRYDRNARRLYMNPVSLGMGQSASQFLGKTPSETGMASGKPGVVGRSFVSLVPLVGGQPQPLQIEDHSQVAIRYEQAIFDVVRSKRKSEYELAWVEAGERGVYHLNFVPELDENGDVVSVLTIGRDISARKAAEERLALREREYRTLIENAPVLIVRYDADLNRTFVNKAWEKSSGVYAEDVAGKPMGGSGRLPLNTDDGYVEKLRQALETGKPQHIEFNWQSPFGSNLFLEYNIVPEFDENEKQVGVLAVGHDITERKRLEEERLQLEMRLEATRTLQSLGQLAGGIAHDFNNLLGAIMGFAQFIAEDAEQESDTARHAWHILTAGKHGKALVEQILSFSRRGEMEADIFPLAVAVRKIEDILRMALPSSLHIDLNIADEDALIEGDQEQIGQVILNLVINAKDAYDGKQGDVAIAVRPPALSEAVTRKLVSHESVAAPTMWSEPDGAVYTVYGSIKATQPTIALVVEDHGKGMGEEVMERMFNPFFTTKEKGRGTGLGLTVVEDIVISHGGALVMRSRPGQGTTVNVIFPRSSNKTIKLERCKVVQRFTTDALASIRILVVDDDIDFGDMLVTALERRGAEVASANEPGDVLEALRENPGPWHVLITDQTMPGMLGSDVIEQAKAIRPDLPCILCTGHAEGISEEQFYKAGADAVMRKPLDLEKLSETIVRLVKR
ncbi:MAG: PAS domain S-box protein [Rhodospirillales bacterium]|nr:PAS domain S-box protein [Rhodospirillales bacterium]